jgi:hypothetical protein
MLTEGWQDHDTMIPIIGSIIDAVYKPIPFEEKFLPKNRRIGLGRFHVT